MHFLMTYIFIYASNVSTFIRKRCKIINCLALVMSKPSTITSHAGSLILVETESPIRAKHNIDQHLF